MTLQLLNYRIQKGGIACVCLSGSMNVDQREQVIDKLFLPLHFTSMPSALSPVSDTHITGSMALLLLL